MKKLLLLLSFFCGFPLYAINHDGCQYEDDICACSKDNRYGYCGVGYIKSGLYCHCDYAWDLNKHSDGCKTFNQPCTCPKTGQHGNCGLGDDKNGLYCLCDDFEKPINGTSVAKVAQLPVTNFQKVLNYFAPYAQIIALNFAATLIHEIGHNLVNLAVNKQWSKIWIGEHGGTLIFFDKDPRLLKDQEWESYLKGRDLRDARIIIPNNSQEKWKLHLVNDDKLFNNDWISVYLPSEGLDFMAFIRSKGLGNKYLDATLNLMGPAFGALFSWLMLQSVHQPNLKFAAKNKLFTNLVTNIFCRGTDGESALKSLNVPTNWMDSAGQQEVTLAESTSFITNIEHVFDIAMFSKTFQAKNEQQRMIALMSQAMFKVLIPLTLHYIKQGATYLIDDYDAFLKNTEDLAYHLNYRKLSSVFNFLRNFLVITVPVILMYEIIKYNAAHAIAQRLTRYF